MYRNHVSFGEVTHDMKMLSRNLVGVYGNHVSQEKVVNDVLILIFYLLYLDE